MIPDILFIVFSLIVSFFIVLYLLRQKQFKETISKTKDQLNMHGKVIERDKKIYWMHEEQKYQILFFYVPLHAELTINSRSIWEIKDGSGSKLVDQTVFLSQNSPKIIIIFPTTQPLKRFINENEMVFIKPEDYFYDMHVISFHNLNLLLEHITS